MKTSIALRCVAKVCVLTLLLSCVRTVDAWPYQKRGGRSYSGHYNYGYPAYPRARGAGAYTVYGGYPGYGGYGGYGRWGYTGGLGYHRGLYATYPAYVPRSFFWSRHYFQSEVYTTGRGWSGGPVIFYVPNEPLSVEKQRERAWGHLAKGDEGRAELLFTAMEQQLPGTAWPKVGNGLVAGFSGDYHMAKYRFRRAFRFDANGPGEVPLDRDMRRKLHRLADYYRGVMARSEKNSDAEFMVAALSYLAGDYSGAQAAIQTAMLNGDVSRSAVNLKRLVDQAVLEAQVSDNDTPVVYRVDNQEF